MTKQTAVEWLVKELNLEGYDYTVQQAKAMEKEQIIDAHQDGHSVTYNNYWAELYYNETYGGNDGKN
jgi:hypothetical protein